MTLKSNGMQRERLVHSIMQDFTGLYTNHFTRTDQLEFGVECTDRARTHGRCQNLHMICRYDEDKIEEFIDALLASTNYLCQYSTRGVQHLNQLHKRPGFSPSYWLGSLFNRTRSQILMQICATLDRELHLKGEAFRCVLLHSGQTSHLSI